MTIQHGDPQRGALDKVVKPTLAPIHLLACGLRFERSDGPMVVETVRIGEIIHVLEL